MNTKRRWQPVVAIITLLFAIAVAPTSALAQEEQGSAEHESVDDADGEDVDEVRMQDMLADDADADERTAAANEPTFQARSDRPEYPSHWSWIIAGNALAGGIAGGLVGAGILLVRGAAWDTQFVGQFVGGGLLIGTTVGLIELLTRTNGGQSDQEQPERESMEVLEEMERQMPTTYDAPVIHIDF